MKKILLIFVALLFGISNSNAQETYSIVVPSYNPPKVNDYTDTYETIEVVNSIRNENGFSAEIKFKYAFKRCFGDIVMAYGYDLKIITFNYNGQSYSLKDLGIDNFEEYITTVEADFRIDKAELYNTKFNLAFNNLSYKIVEGHENSVLKSFDVGCYGQTFTVAKKESYEYKIASQNFFTLHAYITPKINFSKTLVYKIENLNAKKKEQKKRSDAYWNDNSSKSKKRTTTKKKSYWNN